MLQKKKKNKNKNFPKSYVSINYFPTKYCPALTPVKCDVRLTKTKTRIMLKSTHRSLYSEFKKICKILLFTVFTS